MSFFTAEFQWNFRTFRRALIWLLAIAFLFSIYVYGIRTNPPGFYVDESGLAIIQPTPKRISWKLPKS